MRTSCFGNGFQIPPLASSRKYLYTTGLYWTKPLLHRRFLTDTWLSQVPKLLTIASLQTRNSSFSLVYLGIRQIPLPLRSRGQCCSNGHGCEGWIINFLFVVPLTDFISVTHRWNWPPGTRPAFYEKECWCILSSWGHQWLLCSYEVFKKHGIIFSTSSMLLRSPMPFWATRCSLITIAQELPIYVRRQVYYNACVELHIFSVFFSRLTLV